jgi:hypothetical protein
MRAASIDALAERRRRDRVRRVQALTAVESTPVVALFADDDERGAARVVEDGDEALDELTQLRGARSRRVLPERDQEHESQRHASRARRDVETNGRYGATGEATGKDLGDV